MTNRAAATQRAPAGTATPTIVQLTSIRGFAAWWVVLYHFREWIPGIDGTVLMGIFDNGYLAVDFFFTLSGFVIALNYADALRAPRFGSVLRFLGLRLARIYPPHAFMLEWNIPAWSISTEWAAYLAFPVIAVATCAMRATWQAAAYAVFPLPDYVVAPPAFAALIFALTDDTAPLSRLLAWRGIEAIGIVSYSTYLVHYFVKDWVKFLLVGLGAVSILPVVVYLAATALASALSYRLIEAPGRRWLRTLLRVGKAA